MMRMVLGKRDIINMLNEEEIFQDAPIISYTYTSGLPKPYTLYQNWNNNTLVKYLSALEFVDFVEGVIISKGYKLTRFIAYNDGSFKFQGYELGVSRKRKK